MNYCFLRVEKIKTNGTLKSRFNHDYRIADVKNADKKKAESNRKLKTPKDQEGRTLDYNEAFHERIRSLKYYDTHKIRSNAVLAYDILMSYTREADIDKDKWCDSCMQWLEDTFNVAQDGKTNILSAVYHGDEYSPHIHAIVIPVDERGKLNASRFTNGSRAMTDLQTSYALDMERFGLKRGVVKSSAYHRLTQQFYAGLDKAFEAIPKPMDKEMAKEYYDRAVPFMKQAIELSYLDLDKKSRRALQSLDDKYQAYREESDSLTLEKTELSRDIENLKKIRDNLRHEIIKMQENGRPSEREEEHVR